MMKPILPDYSGSISTTDYNNFIKEIIKLKESNVVFIDEVELASPEVKRSLDKLLGFKGNKRKKSND